MRIGFLHSLIRKEEKLLLEAFARHDVELAMIESSRSISKPDPTSMSSSSAASTIPGRCTRCACTRRLACRASTATTLPAFAETSC